jgi:hypothetical protein
MAHALGFVPDPWQYDLLTSTERQCIVLTSRQVGKSTAVALLALHEVLANPNRLVLMVSASLRQASELFRKAHMFWRDLGRPVGANSETTMSLSLDNNSRLLSLPPSPVTVRGYAANLLVVDEGSYTPDLLYQSVRPVLAATQGRLVALSTPWAASGWFHHVWTEGGDDWRRFTADARDCPRITQEFLDAERRALGEFYYASEYEMQFHANVSSVFDMNEVAAAFDNDYSATNFFEFMRS